MSHAASVQRFDRQRRALMVTCLLLGAADLAFVNGVALPRVMGVPPLFSLRGLPGAGAAAPLVADQGVGHPPPNLSPPADGRGEESGPRVRAGEVGRGPLLPRVRAGEVGRGRPSSSDPPPAPPAEAPAAEPAPAPTPTLELTIHFSTAGTALSARARAAVDAVAERAAAHPRWTLAVQGHADARGDAARNERLSVQRARAVAARLQEDGLPEARLQTKSFGATRPVARGDEPEALRRNRRVEILIVRGEP
jgi:outer membrane protein OmpA-like peptidoglycan-associated protein